MSSLLRLLRSLIAGCLLMAFAAPAARAGFTAVPSPGTQAPIVGFAASEGAWLIGQAGVQGARISRDHGQSWSVVALPAGPSDYPASFAGISVGADGAFYLAAVYPYASRVRHIRRCCCASTPPTARSRRSARCP